MAQDFDDELEDDQDYVKRRQPTKTSGKAIASLVLGLMSFLCTIFTGIPAIIVGIWSLVDISKSRGRTSGQGLAICGMITGVLGIALIGPAVLIALLIPAVQKVREAANRIQKQTQSKKNLTEVGLAIHNFAATTGRLPLAYTSSADGKSLLSWRVQILPYLGQDALYKQFKLDEPWDSPTNKALIAHMPDVYKSLNQDVDEVLKGMTRFRVFVGPGTALDKSSDSPPNGPLRGARLPADFPDGTDKTLLVAEALEPVEWTKPEGLSLDTPNLKDLVFGPNSKQFNCIQADGNAIVVPDLIDERTLRNFITRNDGQPVNLP
jgi:hypothetical protein